MSKWVGDRAKCELCGKSIAEKPFVDGGTENWPGEWCLMCISCWSDVGAGLGTGKGQWYNADGTKNDDVCPMN